MGCVRTTITCKECQAQVDLHAQGYCHPCYHKVLYAGKIQRLFNPPKTLTQLQSDIVIGSMLGDGNIRRCGKKQEGNAGLAILRTESDADYLQWEFDILRDFQTKDSITHSSFFDKRTQKRYYRAYFHTSYCEVFNEYCDKWYPNGKKVVPNDLDLNTNIMAVWFLDDGCIYTPARLYTFEITFATNGFTRDEVFFLRDKLVDRYNECFRVTKTPDKTKDQYLIMAMNDASRSLLNDIDPVVIGFMDRKANVWRQPEARFYKDIPTPSRVEKRLIKFIRNTGIFNRQKLGEGLNLLTSNGRVNSSVFEPYLSQYIDKGFVEKVKIDGKSFEYRITEMGKSSLVWNPYNHIKDRL